MNYDEDYDSVSFSVDQEHLQERDIISNAIIDLINLEASEYYN